MVTHVISNAGLQVVLKGQHYNVAATVENYRDILNAIYSDHPEQRILDLIDATRRKVENALKLSVSLTYQHGMVHHHGQKLRGYAVNKLISLIESGREDLEPLSNFLTKIQANPDQTVIDNLYEFLEYGKMPITKSGDFLAYKAIRADWHDIHSGKFVNGLGTYISMPRREVNPDRNQTCSYGFHVCSYGYLPHFAHANGRVVVCQVNPADVVAIPADYDNTKMRVSAYRVIDEVTDYYKKQENVLSKSQVWEETYYVSVKDWQDDWEFISEHDDFEEAVAIAEEEIDESGEAKVVNSAGTMVFYKKT